MLSTGRLGTKHLTRDKQVAFIEGHGEAVLVFPVLQCPCLLGDKQFNPVCPSCHGTGRYYPPGTAYTTKLLMVHEHSHRTFNDPGTWVPGTIQASILPGVRLAERDKVRRLDIAEVFSDEVLQRGVDERLRFQAGIVLRVVADHARVYRPGLDYALTPPNTLTWLAGGLAPPFLGQYSVKYEANPEYLVTPDNPRARVEHQTAQAQVVVMTRLDYLTDEEA